MNTLRFKDNGFVFPTYMGDYSWIVKEFLMKLTVNKDAYIFFIMISDRSESGISFQSLDQTFRKSGIDKGKK